MKDKEKQRFEFRVIDNKTGKEADTYEIALKEDWAKGLIYCDMEGFAILEDGNLVLLDECGKWEYCPSGRFEIIPEDSVVLSREEYDKLKYAWITDSDAYKKGSKETVEKIIDLIKTFCPDKKFIETISHIISERFGLEIKE